MSRSLEKRVMRLEGRCGGDLAIEAVRLTGDVEEDGRLIEEAEAAVGEDGLVIVVRCVPSRGESEVSGE